MEEEEEEGVGEEEEDWVEEVWSKWLLNWYCLMRRQMGRTSEVKGGVMHK